MQVIKSQWGGDTLQPEKWIKVHERMGTEIQAEICRKLEAHEKKEWVKYKDCRFLELDNI